MTLDTIALWLGYGVMVAGGVLAVLLVLVSTSLALSQKINLIGKHLRLYWDLKTLRTTMCQLEAEGKVNRRSEDRQ